MTNNIDKLFNAEQEVQNYSKYIASKIIKIKKYISEKSSGIANTLASSMNGETNLIIAPTGSGKTYSIINMLKEFNIKSIFVLPNSANVEQAMIEYNIPGAYGNDRNAIAELEKGNVVVMTWDKVAQLKGIDLSEYIIVVDEIHQTYTDDYRKKAITGLNLILKEFKGRIDITATPTKLDFSIYDSITEYKQTNQTKYNVTLYDNIDTKIMIDIINKSNHSALLMNDIKELKYISSSIYKSSSIVSSDTKEYSKIYDDIMSKGSMSKYETLLNTTTIVAGVNIKNPNITDIIIVGIKDIGTIKQYVARFRDLKECNVHIFNKFEDECKIYDIEWSIGEFIKSAEKLKKTYNSIYLENKLTKLGINLNPINLDSNIYFNKETNKYEVDETHIRTQMYRQYYNKRTIESFKWLLEEYFTDVKIAKVNEIDKEALSSKDEINKEVLSSKIEYKKNLKEAKEEAIETLFKHKDILVGYEEIKKDKRSYTLMEYQSINNISIEQSKKDYLKYNIHNMILENNLKSLINKYSKYVLENSYSTDIAWKLANMGNRKRGTIFAKINTLVYRELKEEYPNIFANENNIEVRIYEWLISEFKEGINYTSEHLEILTEAFKIAFGDIWSINPKKLSEIINQTYNIESKKTRVGTVVGLYFYKNIIPTGGADKQIRVYTIKDKIKVNDIKNELDATSSDLSIEYSINNRKKYILNKLDTVEKQILLEGLF